MTAEKNPKWYRTSDTPVPIQSNQPTNDVRQIKLSEGKLGYDQYIHVSGLYTYTYWDFWKYEMYDMIWYVWYMKINKISKYVYICIYKIMIFIIDISKIDII